MRCSCSGRWAERNRRLRFDPRLLFILLVSWLVCLPDPAQALELPVGEEPESVVINPSTNQAVVTHEGSKDLRIIDLSSNTVINTISFTSRPVEVAVNPNTHIAVVSLKKIDSIIVVDLSTGLILATINVGKDPQGVGIDPDLNLAVVANEKDDTVSIVDLATTTVSSTLSVGEKPQGVAINPTTNMAVIANEKSDNLTLIDLNTATVIGSIPVAQKPIAIAINAQTNQAVVAHEKDNQVSLIDLATQQVLATIPVGKSPESVAINPTTNQALVANEKDDSLTWIDLATLTVVGTIRTGRNPKGVAIHPDTNIAVVANEKSDTVSILDLSSVPLAASNPVGKDPHGVALHSGLGLAVVANKKDDTISILSLPDGSITATITVGKDPQGVAVNINTNLALITNKKDDTLTLVDLTTQEITATINVGKDPQGVAVNSNTNTAVVANKKDNTVSVIDLSTPGLITTILVGKDPIGVAINPSTNLAAVANQKDDNLTLIDLDSRTVVNTIPVGKKPASVAIHPGTNIAAVANKKSDDLTLIDLSTNTVIATIPVGKDPTGVAIHPAMNQALVANRGDNSVSVVDLATRSVTETLRVGKRPVSVAVDPAANLAVVTNKGSDDVTILTFAGVPDTTPPTINAFLDSPPNGNGWHNQDVTVSFTCTDDDSGIASCPNPILVTTEDQGQVISGMATDVAGNVASVSVTINLDKTPPTLSITSHADGSITNLSPITITGVIDDNASSVTVNGMNATVANSAFQAEIQLTEGPNTITATAIDPADNSATALVTIVLDTGPPLVTITSPTDGFNANQADLIVEGTVDDPSAIVSVNGVQANVTGNTYSATITLNEGTNTVTAQAGDSAGNIGQVQITVILDSTPPVVSITSPANLSTFTQSAITVTGSVDDPQATVVVNGIPATVGSGGFTVSGITLREGTNIITAVATDPLGNVGTASIQVTLDTIPPTLTIDSPTDGFVTTSSSITVTGLINDIVVGSVNADQVTVTVNGINSGVSNRSYLAADVPLSPGFNTITAIGTDQAGNSATSSITVTFEEIQLQPRIDLISGNNQSGPIGSQLPEPLVIALTNDQGVPVIGQAVTFKVVENDGAISDGSNEAVRSLDVTTDAQGRAQVLWTLGTRAGSGNHRVEASAAGFSVVATFAASAFSGTPTKIKVEAGNNQTGIVGQALPNPFITILTDAGGNRVANIPVTFTATIGGGRFNGQSSVTVNTDSDGRAFAVFVLGDEEGFDNNVVQATFSGHIGLPAVFVASAMTAGDPAITRISGVVLDNTNIPIAGVTMKVEGSALETQTDSLGQFVLEPVPVGHVELIADGITAQRPGTWPTLKFELVTISGQNNTLGMPIYLLPLDTASAKVVGGPEDVTLEMANVPGLALTVFSNSVTCPDGSSQCESMITQVHRDKVPMPPIGGVAPRLVWTIQPSGIIFDPPAQITYPNVDGHSPGKIVDIFSFDHDLGQFVAIGTGTVSEDGLVITSDPGVGIRKGGWGYVPPDPPDDTCVKNVGQVSVTIDEAPDFLEIGQTGTLQANGKISQAANCPGGGGVGTYSWSSSDLTVADNPPAGQSSSVTGSTPGTTTISVTFTAPNGQSATADVDVAVPTKDITVIAWIDPDPVDLATLESQATPLLVGNLNTIVTCSFQLAEWQVGKRTNINTDIDRQYANAFLLINSANSQPPNVIDADAIEAAGDFRAFNRFKVSFKTDSGQIVGTPNIINSSALIGATPDPCGFFPPLSAEAHPSNGSSGVTTSATGTFQLNEGRIGFAGQAVDRTLNDCNQPVCSSTVGQTTPYIWSVIRFDSQGNLSPLDHQMFPTYFVYENGNLISQFPQGDLETFISLDSSSQRLPSEIP